MQSSFSFEGLPLRRKVIAIGACLAAAVVGMLIPSQPYLICAGFFALLYVCTIAVNAKALGWLVIALQPAALIIPFFPGRPFWWELCTLLCWPSLLAFFLINRGKFEALRFDRAERRALLALLGYVAVLVVLMAYRGVGFRAFGGEQMGGRFYAQQLILAILPLAMPAVGLSRKQVVSAVVVGWLMTLTYVVSDFAFALGGGLQRLLYFFEIPTDAVNFELGYEASGLRRFQSFWFVGAAAFSAVLVWMPLRDLLGRRVWIGLPLAVGGLALALASGHRAAVVQITFTVLILSIFQRYWTPLRTAGALFFATIFIGAIYLAADSLPLSMQRSISFLPGIEVSPLARSNALDTLNDRIEVLKLAIGDIPQYLWIGRGFGMERFDILPSDAFYTGVWQMYVNGYFYNGLIGSLLKTGLFGFLCTAAFVFYVSQMALRIVRIIRESEEEWTAFERLGLVLCAQWFALVIYFYCLHGDAGTWALVFALPAAMIMFYYRQVTTQVDAPTPPA